MTNGLAYGTDKRVVHVPSVTPNKCRLSGYKTVHGKSPQSRTPNWQGTQMESEQTGEKEREIIESNRIAGDGGDGILPRKKFSLIK